MIINNNKEYEAFLLIVEKFMDADDNSIEETILDYLADIIEKYEDKNIIF